MIKNFKNHKVKSNFTFNPLSNTNNITNQLVDIHLDSIKFLLLLLIRRNIKRLYQKIFKFMPS